HLLVDALQALDQAPDVIVPIPVGPDVLNDFGDRAGGLVGWFGRDGRRSPEVLEQGPTKTVEDSEVRLVGEALTLSCAPAEHLLEEDARLHLTQEYDEFEIRDIDAGRHQIDRHHYARLWPVAEFTDPLERPVDPAGDLAYE